MLRTEIIILLFARNNVKQVLGHSGTQKVCRAKCNQTGPRVLMIPEVNETFQMASKLKTHDD